jgi:hypothetical protein
VLEVDVQFLKNKFINGYKKDDRVLYVSVYDQKCNQFELNAEIEATWNVYWRAVNASFEEFFLLMMIMLVCETKKKLFGKKIIG